MKPEPLTQEQAFARCLAGGAVADLADRVVDVARRDELRHIAAMLVAQGEAMCTEYDTPTYLRVAAMLDRGER